MKHIEALLGGGYRTYYGVAYSQEELKEYFDLLKYAIGDEEFDISLKAKRKRDGNDDLHITVMSAKEFEHLNSTVFNSKPGMIADKLEALNDIIVDDIEMKGIGVSRNVEGDVAYYIVVESQIINDIRKHFGLEDRDLHITLGFNKNDIWNVPKKEVQYTLGYKKPSKPLKESLLENFMNNNMSFKNILELLNEWSHGDYKNFAIKKEGLDSLNDGYAVFYAWNDDFNNVLEFTINSDDDNNLIQKTSCEVMRCAAVCESAANIMRILS